MSMKKRFSVAMATILTVLVAGGGVALAANGTEGQAPVPTAPPYAQDGYGHFHGRHAHDRHFHGRRGFGGLCGNMDARLAGMLAYDRVKLRLTAQQRPAWDTLVHTLEAAQKPVREACATTGRQRRVATLPERLEQGQKMAEARVQSMRVAIPAIAQFYKGLSPEQKRIADRLAHGHRGHHW
jgi:hypothetical protein